MKNSTCSNGKHAPFAITRSFQPVRIELELLAQVFELARRGSSDRNMAAGQAESPSCRATDQAAQRMPESIAADDPHAACMAAVEQVA
jgi:hypothetical protein